MSNSPTSRLILPSSTLTLSYDRFSLTDADTDVPVPFWPILSKILTPPSQSPSQLIEALDTIAVTLQGSSYSTAFLRQFLDSQLDPGSFFQKAWPQCVAIALEMPTLFPDGYLEPLTNEKPTQIYTPREVACLVIHQLLCTLPKLPWDNEENSPDLHIWYDTEQPHPKGVGAYLTALVTFFERIATNSSSTSPITLTLYAAPSTPPVDPTTLFKPLHITGLETPSLDTALLGLPSGACVISANSHIGFGRTASQEEMHVGCSPQSLPAKLVTPPLKDNEVMVLRGCEAMVEMTGYGRTAELASMVPVRKHDWSRRTMLFMDALELDSYDTSALTPDLLPGNVDRELTKAYTAFASYGDGMPYSTVVTGHWGGGAFGGNREIKSIIQWCAASMAGVELNFVCDKSDSFAENFESFTSQGLKRRWTVHVVLEALRDLHPNDAGGKSAFHHVQEILS
ncbi:hypothetical protein B0H11DRAFT_1729779 [Mycena galericulata]|nr:hypothetical protein B0H11DRAFT_1729779 [Mycena galericulata]